MRQSLFDSWDYNVTLIAASAPQADYDAAVASSDVAYISEEIDAVDLGTKLRDAPIGVVNEGINLRDEFGFATGHGFPWPWLDAIQITNNQHHITSQFSLGLGGRDSPCRYRASLDLQTCPTFPKTRDRPQEIEA